MKKVFKGFIPKKQAFFHNILFNLFESDGCGLNQYKEKMNPDDQEFKITIKIEKIIKST